MRQTAEGAEGWVTGRYVVWLIASAVSQLGNGIIAFVIVWTATGLGGGLAGTISALGLLPTVVLLFVSGSIGDRIGQRKLLLIVTGVEVVQFLILLLLLATPIDLAVLLMANAVVAGVIQGAGAPSANVIGRQFVAPEHVRPAISVGSTIGSLVRVVSPATGAACLAVLGLRGSLLLQVLSFLGVLLVLAFLPPLHQPARSASRPPRGRADRGLRSVWRHPTARTALVATVFVAGAVLPFTGLGLPLLVRDRGWDAPVAGTLLAAWTLGSVITSLLISARYARDPQSRPVGLAVGPALAASALAGLLLTPAPVAALVVCCVMGTGTALFTAHVGPLLAALAPPEQQSSWAAASILAQFLPILLINPALGQVSDAVGIRPPLIALAILAGLATIPATQIARQLRHRPDPSNPNTSPETSQRRTETQTPTEPATTR